MRLIKLKAIPHPDVNGGASSPVFVNPDHIVLIERAKHQQERWGWREERRAALNGLWEELQRIAGELSGQTPKLVPENEREAAAGNRWLMRKDAAASIQAAYGLVVQLEQQPSQYPAVECTCIQLSVPNAKFTMLPAVYVVETPDEVATMTICHTQA